MPCQINIEDRILTGAIQTVPNGSNSFGTILSPTGSIYLFRENDTYNFKINDVVYFFPYDRNSVSGAYNNAPSLFSLVAFNLHNFTTQNPSKNFKLDHNGDDDDDGTILDLPPELIGGHTYQYIISDCGTVKLLKDSISRDTWDRINTSPISTLNNLTVVINESTCDRDTNWAYR